MRNLCNKNVDNEENFIYKDFVFDDGSGTSIDCNVVRFLQVCKCCSDAKTGGGEGCVV